MKTLAKKAAVVGVAESDLGRVPDKNALQLLGQACTRALDDAGLVKDDIEAVFHDGIPGFGAAVPRYLGIDAKYVDSTQLGGCAWEAHVEHAVAGIAAGLFDVALLAYGSTLFSDRKRPSGYRLPSPEDPQFEVPYGLDGPMVTAALAAQRHIHQYGLTSEQLAEVAVAARKWAAMNPAALRREPLTVTDVLSSSLICSPFHVLDICLITDGGGAVIIASPERARDLRKPPVWILGCGEATGSDYYEASQSASETALQMAGLKVSDIDVAQLYDLCTFSVIRLLEVVGFCKQGEGGVFVEGGRIAPGGELPMNTSGGGLSYTHPGMFGIFLLIEATRQLRGECDERQIKGARTALCCGLGPWAGATTILGRD